MDTKKNIVLDEKPIFYRICSNIKIQLLLILTIGIITRIYYTPFELPITLDGVQYFWYAIDTSILGELPNEYRFPNNGWPVFLSSIFSLVNSNTFLDIHIIQRLSSIIFSVLTIIPIFLLCRRFFDAKIAIFDHDNIVEADTIKTSNIIEGNIDFGDMFDVALNDAAIKTIEHPDYIKKTVHSLEKVND